MRIRAIRDWQVLPWPVYVLAISKPFFAPLTSSIASNSAGQDKQTFTVEVKPECISGGSNGGSDRCAIGEGATPLALLLIEGGAVNVLRASDQSGLIRCEE